MTDTSVEHITATSHHETDIVASLENLGSSLDEVLWTFLISYTAKESNHLLFYVSLDLELLATCEVYRIVN